MSLHYENIALNSNLFNREEYMDILTYQVPSTDIKWSAMFGLMEDGC